LTRATSLLPPPIATTLSLLAAAVSVAGAVFLIMELDRGPDPHLR
jgi:hypothetical protein